MGDKGRCEVDDEACTDGGHVHCRGMCRKHYQRFLRTGGTAVQYRTRPRKAADEEGWCARCETFKPVSEFSADRSRKNGIKTSCKACDAIAQKDQYDPERDWSRRIKREYGLTPEDYYALLVAQGGVCAICGGKAYRDGRESRLHIDHNHETGRIRGLLCFRCNSTLGRVEDSLELIEKIVGYLEEDRGKQL